MTRVKICGITSEADRDAAVAAGVDAVGVLVGVSVDSPREIGIDRAASLVAGLPPFVSGVLVTMPTSVREALAIYEQVGTDAIQIHQSLSAADVATLQQRIDADVIVAVEPAAAPRYADVADAVLVDSLDEKGGGGTGETHDWEHTRTLVEDLDTPVVLAGGLTPENVGAAVEQVCPYGVDTASGVEHVGGEKDHDAIRAFVSEAQLAGRA